MSLSQRVGQESHSEHVNETHARNRRQPPFLSSPGLHVEHPALLPSVCSEPLLDNEKGVIHSRRIMVVVMYHRLMSPPLVNRI